MILPRPLVLTVRRRDDAVASRHAFLRSPVRVGRAPENDLVLDAPFVSARHGIFQFDDGEVRYADLRSRNGTELAGVRLPPDAAVPITPAAPLTLGDLRIEVARGEPQPLPAEEAPVAAGALTALLERLAATAPAPAEDVALGSLRAGHLVDRFELVRQLGSGGFGVVWEARDPRLGRRVAVKVMRPGVTGSCLGERWLQREAEAAAALGHPNIVSVHDVGSWPGGAFLVMELLRGEPLDARLSRGPLPLADALDVAIDVARALAHAHAAGVVHRDLKPSNVFLGEEGFAKVLDFGLAHVFGAGGAAAGGTPRYMAPEQRLGAPPAPSADVFGAALVLHETLVGVAAAGDASASDVAYPEAPSSLARLVGEALSGDPRARPADGRQWLDALLGVQRQAWRGPWSP